MTEKIVTKKRIVTKIGDVFCVEFGDGTKGYFQYIADDKAYMNSRVIRAFRKHYPIEKNVSIDEIINDNVDFYAHAILKFGIIEKAWYKVGKSLETGTENLKTIIFGQTDNISNKDYISEVDPKKNWSICKVNEDLKHIGKLPKKLYNSIQICGIFPFHWVVGRMQRGYFPVSMFEYDVLKREPRPEYISYIKFEETDLVKYLCFKGDYFEKEIIATENGITRITRDDAIINHMDIAKTKFSDLYLEYQNFITEDEFNELWNSVD